DPAQPSTRDTPSGQERTGLDLLMRKAIEGEVEHLYQDDVESFVWLLAWVCLHYREGQL
ncbi:hypothetical protein CY34DRAFT_29658, partial [Suillus luteus UH-Slu-Lm8-n1]